MAQLLPAKKIKGLSYESESADSSLDYLRIILGSRSPFPSILFGFIPSLVWK